MPDAVTPTTPQSTRLSAPRPWITPRLVELPKLTALTLASAIGGGGGTGGGGSTVFALLLAVGLALGGCSTDRAVSGEPGAVTPPISSQMISCTVRKAVPELTCAAPSAAPGIITLGSQGVSVGLRSSNVSYDGGTDILSATVTVQNLSQVAIGTLDGSTVGTGIDVFFFSGPTGSLGEIIGLPNKDGLGTYTGSDQPYFRYVELLTPSATSTGKSWQFLLNGASAFTFTVLVSAETPSAGALLNWSPDPTMGYSNWGGIVGWGTSGLAVLGDEGARGITENGVWRTRPDGPSSLYSLYAGHQMVAAGGGASNLYALIGNSSNIRYWDGIGWRTISTLPGGPGTKFGKIVSDGTTLYSFTDAVRRFVPGSAAGGGTWNTLPSPVAEGTWPLAADVAKGQLICYFEDQSVWSWNGVSWISRGNTGISGATHVVASDTNDIWVYVRTFPGVLRHYGAGGWTDATGLPGSLSTWLLGSGDATSAGEYYFTASGPGGNQIWHWTSSAWIVEFSNSSKSPRSIYVRNADTVYAAGLSNLLLKRTGGSWSYVSGNIGPVAGVNWEGVAVTDKNDVMLGAGGGKTYHWDGATWTPFNLSGFTHVDAFWKGPGSDLYAVGGSTINRWTGSGWVAGPGGGNLNGVGPNGIAGTGPNDIWVVGVDAQLPGGEPNITHWNGVSWTKTVNPHMNSQYNAVWAYADTMAVAVAIDGKIARWDGTSWTAVNSGVTGNLVAVWGYSPTEIWAVGNPSTIRHWNGTAWVDGGSVCDGSSPYAIWGKSPTEIYLATGGGRLCFYNGTSWSEVALSASPGGPYNTIAGDPTGSVVYAAGGSLVRGTR